jgi:lysine 2,3-aminomutase
VNSNDDLTRFINLSAREAQAFKVYKKKILPFSITPHYMRLVDPNNPEQAIRKTVIPTKNEFIYSKYEQQDPLHEAKYSPVPCIVHRYSDRVLFLVTTDCSVYCRYCTRSRIVGMHNQILPNKKNWGKAIQYIKNNPMIRDVLISGGDPLTMEDNNIEWLLQRLRRIPAVEIIRIGTKTPVTLPQRITPQLCKMLKKYHPLFISLHFTHPDELITETAQACCRLADAGIPLGSQTVLLSGINDNIETMQELMQGLLKIRVKPYYILQCDPILGSGHFRVPVKKGLEIIGALCDNTSGYAVPAYVMDVPGKSGKIQLLPKSIIKK